MTNRPHAVASNGKPALFSLGWLGRATNENANKKGGARKLNASCAARRGEAREKEAANPSEHQSERNDGERHCNRA